MEQFLYPARLEREKKSPTVISEVVKCDKGPELSGDEERALKEYKPFEPSVRETASLLDPPLACSHHESAAS